MDSAYNGNKIYVPEKILHRFVFLEGHFIFWRWNLRWKTN